MVDLLILDADALTRTMLETLFTSVGYTVAQADNGADGLALVLKHTPRVILADLDLPHIGGLAFARRLQRQPSISRTHLFFTSVHLPIHLIDAGQLATFTKPFDLEDLLDQVARVAPRTVEVPRERERWVG